MKIGEMGTNVLCSSGGWGGDYIDRGAGSFLCCVETGMATCSHSRPALAGCPTPGNAALRQTVHSQGAG